MGIPEWLRPWVGWVVGTDWPEADERVLFRLADGCVLAARKVVVGAGGDGARLADSVQGEWDGEALKAFAKRVGEVVGGRQAKLVGQLVALARGLNGLGVQVQYTKRMIKLAVLLFIVQMAWLVWALANPVGGLTAAATFGVRAQAARWTVRQFAQRLLMNVAFFGLLMGGMDLYVQASQTRRDGIDWAQVGSSAGIGALTGGLLTGLAWALPTRSLWMLMGHSGVASAGATLAAEAMSGRPIDWEVVAKGFTSGVLGGADAHWASWSPHGGGHPPPRGGDPGTPPRALGGAETTVPIRIRDGDDAMPAPPHRPDLADPATYAVPEGTVARAADGTSERQTALATAHPEPTAHRAPRAGDIDQMINWGRNAEGGESAGGPGSIIDPLAHHFGRDGDSPAAASPEPPPRAEGPRAEGQPRPAPELTARQQELIRQSRHEVAAGVWYRDPATHVMPTADPRLLRPTDGILDVGIAGDGTHFLIGEQRLTATDLGTMLAHDPRVLADPDAALRVLGCETATNHRLLQDLANTTGREIIAGDRLVYIGADRQAHTAAVQGYTPDGRPIFPGRDDGAWHRAVPESRVLPPERPAQVPVVWPEPERGLTADTVQAAAAAHESQWHELGAGSEGLADLFTLDDGTGVVRKIMHGDAKQVATELVVSQVAKSIEAPVADARPHPGRPDAVLMEYVPGRTPMGADVRFRPGAVLLELLDVLVVNLDRHRGNLLLTVDGLFGIDHGRSFNLKFSGLDVYEHLLLRGNFLGRRPDGTFGWIDNPLTRQDVELMTERLHGLRTEFERHDMLREYDVMMDRLYHVARHATGDTPLIAHPQDRAGGAQQHFGRDTEPARTVYRDEDIPVRRFQPGKEFTLPETVVSGLAYNINHRAPLEVVTYSRTGRDLGDGRVAHAPGTKMKIIGAHHQAFRAPDGQPGTRLFMVELGPEPLPVRQAPDLQPRHRELIERFRQETDSGVWYRDPTATTMPTADPRLLRSTDGILDVGIAGDGTHFLIGEQRLTARDLGTMLVHDPRLLADPDAALRVLGCETATNHRLLQDLANTTGREIIAGDRLVYIGADRQAHTAAVQGYTPDGRPIFPGRDDGAWHIAVPDTRIEPPAVAADVRPAGQHLPAVPEALHRAAESEDVNHVPLGRGEDGAVDLVLDDGRPLAVKKVMHSGAQRLARLEAVVSQVGRAIEANVAHVILDPYKRGAVIGEYIEGSSAMEIAHALPGYRTRRDAILIGLLDILTGNVDRHAGNLLVTDDGRLFGIDHARAYNSEGLRIYRGQPFARNFFGRRPDGLFGWVDNPLTRSDIELITQRIQALRPEFERHDLLREYEFTMDRLYHVAEHATGDTPLIATETGPAGRTEHHFGWD
ncbi:hypothetical protein ABZ297_04950 [Nonomuraea sp. NPDC005983]|uniref:WXG100-like domain-containing protein n=1 Tax=Nonomuraea sp. NPDC005983 TaxID=3155595 RepID=UPI0033AE0DE6